MAAARLGAGAQAWPWPRATQVQPAGVSPRLEFRFRAQRTSFALSGRMVRRAPVSPLVRTRFAGDANSLAVGCGAPGAGATTPGSGVVG